MIDVSTNHPQRRKYPIYSASHWASTTYASVQIVARCPNMETIDAPPSPSFLTEQSLEPFKSTDPFTHPCLAPHPPPCPYPHPSWFHKQTRQATAITFLVLSFQGDRARRSCGFEGLFSVERKDGMEKKGVRRGIALFQVGLFLFRGPDRYACCIRAVGLLFSLDHKELYE